MWRSNVEIIVVCGSISSNDHQQKIIETFCLTIEVLTVFFIREHTFTMQAYKVWYPTLTVIYFVLPKLRLYTGKTLGILPFISHIMYHLYDISYLILILYIYTDRKKYIPFKNSISLWIISHAARAGNLEERWWKRGRESGRLSRIYGKMLKFEIQCCQRYH